MQDVRQLTAYSIARQLIYCSIFKITSCGHLIFRPDTYNVPFILNIQRLDLGNI